MLPLDDDFLFSVARSISSSELAGKRMGKDWLPDANRIETKAEADDAWATKEELKPLDDACTKWCSETFFPNAFARMNMVANVTRLYDRLAKVSGLKFRVSFKGGVMMRLVLLEFLHGLPAEERVKAVQYMQENRALSLSDFDFEVVPDNHDAPEEDVLRYFALDYAALLWLLRQMQREIEGKKRATEGGGSLLFMDWDGEERARALAESLQQVVDSLPKGGSCLCGARIDRVVLASTDDDPPRGYRTRSGKGTPSPRKNVVVYDCEGVGKGKDASAKCVLPASDFFGYLGLPRGVVPDRAGGACLYATLNTYIGEGESKKREGHLGGVFHLSRIKHGFVVYYTTKSGEKRCDRLGGELIDLSQSAGNSRDELRRALYADLPSPYRDYPVVGVDPSAVVLRSYSPEGFMLDLRQQVHANADYPWEAGGKTGKRILRYVAFLFLHVMGPNVAGSRAAKVAALSKARDATSSLSSLLSSGRTSVPCVDAFLSQERRTVRAGIGDGKSSETRRAIEAYVRTLHQHMQSLLTFFEIADHLVFGHRYFSTHLNRQFLIYQ